MDQNTFTIVFEKLAEVTERDYSHTEASRAEIDEIDELRRLVLEISEPEPQSYTTT